MIFLYYADAEFWKVNHVKYSLILKENVVEIFNSIRNEIW